MSTLTWVTSFPHKTASTNTYASPIFSSITGTPTFGTANARASGTYMILAPAGAAVRAGKSISASNVGVASFYFRLPSLPASGYVILAMIYLTDNNNAYFVYDADRNQFSVVVGSGTNQYITTLAVVANAWYRLDICVTANANPHTADWKVTVDSTETTYTGTQATYAAAASTVSGWRLGTSQSDTYTCWYTDFLFSVTSEDYPIGTHNLACLSPSSDGTNNAGVNTMEANDGTDIGATTAYDKINSVAPGTPSTTTYIKQSTAGTGNYIEVNLSNLPANTVPIGVMGCVAYTGASAGTDQFATGAWNGSTFFEIYGNPTTRQNYALGSTTNLYYECSILNVTLTKAVVDALLIRAGYSNDVSPVPYLIDVWLEVAYTTSAVITSPDERPLGMNKGITKRITTTL